jgi:hypothetical protein
MLIKMVSTLFAGKTRIQKKNTPRHWCPSNMNGKGKCIPRMGDGKNMYRSICIPDTEEVLNKQKYKIIKMIIKKKLIQLMPLIARPRGAGVADTFTDGRVKTLYSKATDASHRCSCQFYYRCLRICICLRIRISLHGLSFA